LNGGDLCAVAVDVEARCRGPFQESSAFCWPFCLNPRALRLIGLIRCDLMAESPASSVTVSVSV
jgi:hypothetical protein